MPSKRGGAKASAGKEDADSGKSDAEILKERRRIETFDSADACLRGVGWWLSALGAAWFFIYGTVAPPTPTIHLGAGDATLGLLVAGGFCRGLSRTSPKGAWTWWRRLWHLGWAMALGLMAVTFANAGLSAKHLREPGAPGAKSGFVLAGICGLAAIGMALLCPPGAPCGAKGSASCPLGKMLLLADGAFGLALGGSMIAFGPWGAPLAPAAIVAGAMPLGMWGLATLLCATEAEVLVAVPSAMLLYLLALGRSLVFSGVMMAAPMAVMLVLHAALYLPLPASDADSNPFYMALQKKLSQFSKLLTEPVSGFGDEG